MHKSNSRAVFIRRYSFRLNVLINIVKVLDYKVGFVIKKQFDFSSFFTFMTLIFTLIFVEYTIKPKITFFNITNFKSPLFICENAFVNLKQRMEDK